MKISIKFIILILNINLIFGYTIGSKFNSEETLAALTLKYLRTTINESLIAVRNELNETCYESINDALEEPNQLYMMKLMKDSAKNKNDLGSYLDCFTINYKGLYGNSTSLITNNLTYIIFHIKKKAHWYNITDIRYETGNYIFGGCVMKGCNPKEYKLVFNSINLQVGIFSNTSENDIEVFVWAHDDAFFTEPSFYLNLIPFYFIIFFLLWSCFPIIPVKLFKCCFKKKVVTVETSEPDYNSEEIRKKFQEDNDNELNQEEIPYDKKQLKENTEEEIIQQVDKIVENNTKKFVHDQTLLNKFKHCFYIYENAEEILNTNMSIYNVNINNDSGLSIVKGIRGITMMFTIMGIIFQILYKSPIKIFCNISFRNLVMGFCFSFILFGLRYGPRILFAISGYCLIYKILCYLDNEVERIENEMKAENCKDSTKKINSVNDFVGKKIYQNDDLELDRAYTLVCGNHVEQSNKKNDSLRERKNSVQKGNKDTSNNLSNTKYISYQSYSDYSSYLPNSSLVYFIFMQTYKYILYIIAIFFFKYSYYSFIAALYSPGPLWVYLKEIIINAFKLRHMISMLFLFSNYHEDFDYDFDLFWVATNEIFYFLVFSTFIFYFYKKNKRFDLFIISLFLIIVVGKVVLFFMINSFCVDQFLPALSFQTNNLAFIVKNPIYNMSYYLIGIFFGSVNYCIQKSINNDNFHEFNKNFLKLPCKFRSSFRNNQSFKIYFYSIFFALLFFTTIFGYMIIYNNFFSTDEYMNEFYHRYEVNLFFLLDIEFGIVFLFMILIPLFLVGDNFIISFFIHDYWNFLARPYFIYILLLQMIALYVFYQSESRIKLELFNIIFFSLLVLMIILMFCACCYILYEVPMKKLNKFIIEQIKNKPQITEENSYINNKVKNK